MNWRWVLTLGVIMLFTGKGVLAEPIYIAHRGANREADENTIKAFAIAIQYQVDYIETDPRLTKDGIFIAMHDPTLERTTNGKGKVKKFTLAEIKSLRTKNGEEIPTIEEVLLFAKDKGIGVYLDTKEKTIPALKQLVELAIRCGMSERVIIGVWNKSHLEWMHKNHPEIITGISWPWPPMSLNTIKAMGADWIGTLPSLATPQNIKRAHQSGLKMITLEINDPKIIEKKIEYGLDAILTDHPKILKAFKN